jgi:outer membrane protein OmpA-like peptidoglycan-associated protein
LIINEKSLRFGFASTSLGEDAKKALRKAVPKYFEIIHLYPKFLNRIQTIEISGHTDQMDSAYANPYISRERAGQVLSFLLAEPKMFPFVDFLMKKAVVSGYSATLFPKECHDVKCAAARRVEIKIRLDETNALIEFLNILKDIIN